MTGVVSLKAAEWRGKREVARRIVTVLAVTAALLPIGAATDACQTDPVDLRTAVKRSDAAFIGKLISHGKLVPIEPRPLGPWFAVYEETNWRFRVEQVVKGRLGGQVVVTSNFAWGCRGYDPPEVGKQIGLLLTREGKVWRVAGPGGPLGLDEFRRAAGPLPVPDGKPPASFLVGGSYGEVRTIAVDKDWRVVGHGRGEGATVKIDVCPGSRRAVEAVLVENPDNPEAPPEVRVAVRDIDTLEVLRESALPELSELEPRKWSWGGVVSCRDSTGDEIFLAAPNDPYKRQPHWKLVRVRAGNSSVLFDRPAGESPYRPSAT